MRVFAPLSAATKEILYNVGHVGSQREVEPARARMRVVTSPIIIVSGTTGVLLCKVWL